MQGHPGDFSSQRISLQDLLMGRVQDQARISSMIAARSPQDLLTRTRSRENFTRISIRSLHKEPRKIMQAPFGEDSTGSPQDLPTRSRKDLLERTFSGPPFYKRICQKNAASRDCDSRFLASLRNRNTFGHRRIAVLCKRSEGKCLRPRTATSLRRPNALEHVTGTIVRENLQVKWPCACRLQARTQKLARSLGAGFFLEILTLGDWGIFELRPGSDQVTPPALQHFC